MHERTRPYPSPVSLSISSLSPPPLSLSLAKLKRPFLNIEKPLSFIKTKVFHKNFWKTRAKIIAECSFFLPNKFIQCQMKSNVIRQF